MSLKGAPAIFGIDAFVHSSDQRHNLGACGDTGDGRLFRYAQASSSGQTAGKLQCAPSPKTNHHDVTAVSASAINDKSITVTLGATLAAVDEYNEGWLMATDVAPEGTSWQIEDHPAAESGATLKLDLEKPLVEAVTTSSQFCLVHNTYNAVQESSTQTLAPAGVPLVDMAANYYGWLQVYGPCPVLADETINLGAWVTIGASTAGAVEDVDDVSAPLTEVLVGWAIVAGVNEEYRPIFLTIG